VEVAPLANPPVCRIMDYGKFKFDAAQRAKESRRKTSNVGIKEMKYRPKIGPGDFDTKTRQVLRFLSEGHKVKVTVMFRDGRSSTPTLASAFSSGSQSRSTEWPRSRWRLAWTDGTWSWCSHRTSGRNSHQTRNS